MIYKIIGAIGIILISIGIIKKGRRYQDISYILGGFFLLAYSISVRDLIFILVQVIFIIAAIYDLIKNKGVSGES